MILAVAYGHYDERDTPSMFENHHFTYSLTSGVIEKVP